MLCTIDGPAPMQQALCRCGGLGLRQWPVTAEKMQAVQQSGDDWVRARCWTHVYQGDIPARPVVRFACTAGRGVLRWKGWASIIFTPEFTMPEPT